MIQKMYFASFLWVCLFISSCSDDAIVAEPVVGNTQTDMEILSRFIDVNLAANEYYINGNKKTRVLSYVTGSDWRDLEKVSPVNVEKCKNNLAVLNAEVARAITDPEIAYMVFSVNGKTLVKKLRDTDFDFASSQTRNTATRTLPYSLNVNGEREASTGKFKEAGRTLRMNVNLNLNAPLNSYFFQVSGPNTKTSSSTPQSVAFSGTDPFLNPSFIWTAYPDSKENDGLFSWEFKSKGSTPGFGPIAQCTFSD